MTVRQVATDYSGCREIFVRYGEPEQRPGKFGHLEPLERFAARSGIPLDRLLAELSAAAGVEVGREGGAADRIHRPFLAASLGITLTLGAGWGAWLLFEIGLGGNFGAAAVGQVVAHGEAQLWGFVAMFIMGIALRYLPVTTSAPRPRPWEGRALLVAVFAGVVGGFLWSLASGPLFFLGPASGAALLVASLIFLMLIGRQVAGKLAASWARFIMMAGVWTVVWACITVAMRTAASAAGPGEYSYAMRMLVIQLGVFGLGLNAIYGFGQKLLAGFLGSGSLRAAPIRAAFWLHNLSVALLVIATLFDVPSAACLGPPGLLVGAALYAIGFRGFRQGRRMTIRPEQGEAAVISRYIQLAFFWLIVGLGLLSFGELYPRMTSAGEPLPHAYFGAVRHALTVGFITTLIMGVGQRLVPILEHTRLAWPRLVLPIFVLVAVGNLLRVASELATPAIPIAFPIMPVSSVLEFVALMLFAANLLRTIWPKPDPASRTGQVGASSSVCVLLARHFWLEDELQALGFHYLARARSIPAELTLGTLAASEGKDVDVMVARINALLRDVADNDGQPRSSADHRRGPG